MSDSIFIKYIEIPVRIYATHQKAEQSSGFYPGCPEAWGIERIEICNYGDESSVLRDIKDLGNSIMKAHEDDWAAEAGEHE